MEKSKCANCKKDCTDKYEGKYIGWQEYRTICGKCYRKLTRYNNHWFSGALDAGGRIKK